MGVAEIGKMVELAGAAGGGKTLNPDVSEIYPRGKNGKADKCDKLVKSV